MTLIRLILIAFLATLTFHPANAQGALVAFGDVKQNTDQPVEVEADTLAINQEDGTATFSGNVLIVQGEMRLSAANVQVYYHAESKRIERLHATGGVTVVSGDDAAEGQEANYNIDTGNIVMNGNVLLVQGQNVLSAAHMTINTKAGTAQMGGRVKTILNTGN